VYLSYKHGAKSYEIINDLLGYLSGQLRVLDLTYGVGRFYRLCRNKIDLLIGVDVIKYGWEVKPDIFLNVDAVTLIHRMLDGFYLPFNLIVVDPPWSREKRGKASSQLGISSMPYHVRSKPSETIINKALTLAEKRHVPLLYRYKQKLPCNHMVYARAEVKIIRNTGTIHYGICRG
jgi:hypothetical protein